MTNYACHKRSTLGPWPKATYGYDENMLNAHGSSLCSYSASGPLISEQTTPDNRGRGQQSTKRRLNSSTPLACTLTFNIKLMLLWNTPPPKWSLSLEWKLPIDSEKPRVVILGDCLVAGTPLYWPREQILGQSSNWVGSECRFWPIWVTVRKFKGMSYWEKVV